MKFFSNRINAFLTYHVFNSKLMIEKLWVQPCLNSRFFILLCCLFFKYLVWLTLISYVPRLEQQLIHWCRNGSAISYDSLNNNDIKTHGITS